MRLMLHIRGFRIFAIIACIACVVACNNKEIAQMQEQIKQLEQMQEQIRQHEEELQQLKVQVEALNETVSALQGAVVQMQSLSYVTGVAPDIRDGVTIGYTVVFSSGESIYMSCSAQETPRVGIKAMSSDRYYWTLNDELMLNDDGYIIPVEKNSAPLFKTQGTDWYVSINGGRTWEATSSGASASTPFKSIDTSNPNYVLITLSDGTVLQLTTWSAHVALQNVVEQLRKNMAATNQILEAVNQRDYLTAITPLFDNGVQTGWILSFLNSGSITISCTGDVSDIQDLPEELKGGNYITQIDTSNPNYVLITLGDGTVLQLTTWSAHMALKNLVNQLNNNLAATRTIVNALDQRDYLVGTTPIIENGELAGWYFEFAKSGNVTVYAIGDSPDIGEIDVDIEDGPYITDIDSFGESFVRLILSDSSSIDIPRYLKNTLSVDIPSEGVIIKKNIFRILDFTISGTNPEEATVYATSDGNFVTEVLRTSATTGRVTITCTRVFARGYVLLLLDSGGSTSTTRVDIDYESETMPLSGPFDTFEYATGAGGIIIPAEGGVRRLQNIYGIGSSLMWSTTDWVTMSHDSGDYIIYAQPNPYREDRYHTFYFDLFGSVLVKQLGNPEVPANPYWSCELITIPADGSEQTILVKSGPSSTSFEYPPWIHHLVLGESDSDGIMPVTVSADPRDNLSITERYGFIRIDNNYTIGDISVVQLGWQRKAPQ